MKVRAVTSMRFYACYALMLCALFFVACKKKETRSTFNNLSAEELAIFQMLLNEDGNGVHTWTVSSVMNNNAAKTWDGFTISTSKTERDGKTAIAYSVRLPNPIANDDGFKRVWPLAGTISSVSATGGVLTITRYVGEEANAEFKNGQLSIAEQGDNVRLTFRFDIMPATEGDGSNARTAGEPEGAWVFVVERTKESEEEEEEEEGDGNGEEATRSGDGDGDSRDGHEGGGCDDKN